MTNLSKACLCGCGALPFKETETLANALRKAGLKTHSLKICEQPTTVIAEIDNVQENTLVDKLSAIRGVMYNYSVTDNLGGHYTVHCEVVL